MKKKILTMFMICCLFMLSSKVSAKGSISCDKSVIVGNSFECKVTVDSEPLMIKTDKVKISSIRGESYSKINNYEIIFYKSGTINLGPAESKYNNYLISLYNEAGTESYDADTKVNVIPKTTTTITTTTTRKKSSNNYLSEITIDGKAIEDFSKTKNKYYVTVKNNVSKVLINAKKEDEYAKLDISGPKSLEVGDNEYTIGVTSEDDTTKFYKVIVTREEEGKSSDTKLKNIKIKGYKLNFDNKAKTFYLKIKENDLNLDISVITNDEKAEYEITGNENLKDGSVIKIKVIAEDLSDDIYRIIIQKDKKNYVPLIIIVSIFTLLILIILFILILKKKKKNNAPKEKSSNSKDTNIKNDEKEDTKKIESLDQEKIPFDNDAEEKTTFFEYEGESNDKTIILNTLSDGKLDDEITKTIIFDDSNKE